MNKIVELLINVDELEFDNMGVDIMSLVDKPAIGVNWQAFAEESFVMPEGGEEHDPFMSRCISVVVGEGYPSDQAAAICHSYWEEVHGPTEMEECTDCFDLEDACWPGWEAIGTKQKNGRTVPNCVPVENREQFEAINDYPQAVKENAARGIRLNEKIDNKCATQVGKVRAQQLANGENISEDTVMRMYSYLSRAKEYYNPDDTEACGTISYLLWGGEEALNWSERKLKQLEELRVLALAADDKFGEEYDPETAVIIDGTKNEFESIGDYLKGVRALDILGKRDTSKRGQTKYRYAGPPAERNFCRAMQRLRKIYTREEIDEMDRINTGFRHNGQPYSIFDFKGGVNCKHYWEELEVFKNNNNETVMISRGPVRGRPGQSANASNNYWRYPGAFAFSQDDEQIVVGPAMIPNILIPRRDAMGNIFHVFFSKETIKDIAERFMKEQKLHNTDVNHNDEVVQENTLLESWLVEDPKRDKSSLYGFDVPAGTWMTSYKINNSETWKKIKDGELNGFSIAGNFLEKAIKN